MRLARTTHGYLDENVLVSYNYFPLQRLVFCSEYCPGSSTMITLTAGYLLTTKIGVLQSFYICISPLGNE